MGSCNNSVQDGDVGDEGRNVVAWTSPKSVLIGVTRSMDFGDAE